MDVFQTVMNIMEKYFDKSLKKYINEKTEEDRYEVGIVNGVAIYKGTNHIYTLSKADTIIKTKEATISFADGLSVSNNGNNLLVNNEDIIKVFSDSIRWEDGRDNDHRNMMFGGYKISSNVVKETFEEKKESLVYEIKRIFNC